VEVKKIYIKVPKDVVSTKKKAFMGASWREIGVCSIGLLPSYLVFNATQGLGMSTSMLLFALIFSPFGFIAFFKKNGQTADELLRRIWRQKVRTRQIRLYRPCTNSTSIAKIRGEGANVTSYKKTGKADKTGKASKAGTENKTAKTNSVKKAASSKKK